MMNVIINEGLYDRDFVGHWTHGFDRLRDRVQEDLRSLNLWRFGQFSRKR